MFQYEKALQYPVNITRPNAKLAKVLISQFGGPDGELGASLRYLSQRFAQIKKRPRAIDPRAVLLYLFTFIILIFKFSYDSHKLFGNGQSPKICLRKIPIVSNGFWTLQGKLCPICKIRHRRITILP